MSYFDQFNTLDPDKARAACGGGFIQRTGKYIGKFTQAVCIEPPSGAKGVEFSFISDTGEQADFSIFTCGRDGNEIYGLKQLHAIMTCLRLRGATVAMQKASVWDNNERKRVEKLMPQLVGMLNKPIGILLEMEEYINGNGDIKNRMNFKHAFEAATELMADEILDKKTVPERLPREVAKLKDQFANQTNKPAPFNASKPQSERNPPPADYDDDIPFN